MIPVLEKKIIKSDQILFKFDCGDMWKRKKVSRWDDIDECLKVINIQLKKKQKILKGKKLKKFSWIMNYTIPDENNIKSLKKNNKYTVQKHNIHRLQPIEFSERNKTLNVCEDLLFLLNENIIILLANKLAGLKKICFWMGLLDLGFLEDEPDQQGYIHEKLKKKDWWEHTLQIKERYGRMDDEDGILHDNDLDGLDYLKSEINPKIKFEFINMDKEDKKILEKYSIIQNTMKKNKRISIKYLGSISSTGSDRSNLDTFNIYSKSSLFNYDNAKELNKLCVLMQENSEKNFKGKTYKKKYFPALFHEINLKKKNFFPESWYMDDIGNAIDVNLIKHPDIGEGIIYSPSFSMFDSAGTWLKSSFIKHFMKIEKTKHTIKIDDNKLCFGFFDEFDLDFRNMKEFFKEKNKKNIKEFQIYINEKYDNIVKNRTGSDNFKKNEGSCVLECRVPNGNHKFYSLISNQEFKDTIIEKGIWMGDLILYKKKVKKKLKI